LEVVDLEAMAHSAARHAALRVAEQHGAGDLGGEGAGALPDVEHGSCFVDEDGLDRRAGPKLLEEGVGDGDAGDLGGSGQRHRDLEVRP
jgi:hypothetical protein